MKSLPSEFIESLKSLPIDLPAFLAAHEKGEEIVSLRLNPDKTSEKKHLQNKHVPWCENGFYLPERPSFTFDPDFHAGCYYVQEASSMFLEQVFYAIKEGSVLRVLDLCAAPGGKSTHLLSLLNHDDLLISNEVIKSRTPVLGDNINRWGKPNAWVSQNDPKDFSRLKSYFDVIVVDAPCSGSGMFRKDPHAINEWSPELVELCSKRQKRILSDIFDSLKPGGHLIYSTCSYSKEENEDICDWLSENFEVGNIRIPLDSGWNITETISDQRGAHGYRFYPQLLQGEGFFIAAFQKQAGDEPAGISSGKKEKAPKVPDELSDWLNTKDMAFKTERDEWLAILPHHEADWQFLSRQLRFYKPGVRLGKFAGKDFIPHHELAQSLLLSPKIERQELDRETAVRYLRKENIQLDVANKGWLLATYNGNGLGWMKALPNRVNNYYPKEIRILKQVPEF